MRLDKFNRSAIREAALKALHDKAPPQFSKADAIAMFGAWHNAWMPKGLEDVYRNPVLDNYLATSDNYVEFGSLSNRRSSRDGQTSVRYFNRFEDEFEPIIDLLDEGKTLKPKQWKTCPPAVREWLVGYYKYKRQRDEAVAELDAALNGSTTTESLIKKWPALTPFVPRETANLPAVPNTGLKTFESLVANPQEGATP